MNIIHGSYLNDLLEQPDVLHSVRSYLESASLEPKARSFRRIVLTGMGSSLHALYPLHRALVANGIASHWIETAELLLGFDSLYSKETMLIAVSQSGESAEVVQLLSRAEEFGHVIGITNDIKSRLGQKASSKLILQAGVESTVSCKTYVATLAVLHWLRGQLTGGNVQRILNELQEVEQAARSFLASYQEHVAELLPLLDGVTSVFVTGRADSLASAGTGGLILKESTRLHAEGMSAAAFRHGPLEMAGENVLVLIYEGDSKVAPLHHRLAEDIRRGGGKAILIGPSTTGLNMFKLPMVSAAVQPILEILPVQMLSLALAARDGFEAGRFVRATKITVTA